jgi:hypothetical protein
MVPSLAPIAFHPNPLDGLATFLGAEVALVFLFFFFLAIRARLSLDLHDPVEVADRDAYACRIASRPGFGAIGHEHRGQQHRRHRRDCHFKFHYHRPSQGVELPTL